jgi:hypothetical protein
MAEESKLLAQAEYAVNSMFLPNEASRDMLMEESVLHSINSPNQNYS